MLNFDQSTKRAIDSVIGRMLAIVSGLGVLDIGRDSEIAASCIIYPLKLKRDSSATNYLVTHLKISNV